MSQVREFMNLRTRKVEHKIKGLFGVSSANVCRYIGEERDKIVSFISLRKGSTCVGFARYLDIQWKRWVGPASLIRIL